MIQNEYEISFDEKEPGCVFRLDLQYILKLAYNYSFIEI